MLYCFEDVKAFQEKFGVPMPERLALLNDEAYNFRLGFLKEERQEFVDSHVNRDFEGCIDALLDEIYVACGTSLMMGVSNELWTEVFVNVLVDPVQETKLSSAREAPPGVEWVHKPGPRFLNQDEYNEAITKLNTNLDSFVHHHFFGKVVDCTQAMCAQVALCYNISYNMGVRYSCFQEMWADVQRANMTKVRATHAGQSKRKTALDVVKPAGWVGPDGGKILDFHFPNWKKNLGDNND